MSKTIKVSVLYNFMLQNKTINTDDICEHFINYLKIKNLSGEIKNQFKTQLKLRFLSKFNRCWKQCFKSKLKFSQKYKKWLETSILFNITNDSAQFRKISGRPKKDYAISSDRSKRRKKKNLRSLYTQDEISASITKKKTPQKMTHETTRWLHILTLI